jgi:RNA polymerase sigma-70 factor (ECF subfamily)
MKKYSEEDIIKACKKNSREHQEYLYLDYFDRMYGMCLRHTSDDTIAMSVLNDGFIKVFKNIGKYRFEGSFEGWVRKIIYNSIRDYYRKKSNNQKFIEIQDKSFTSEIYNTLEYDDIIDLVNKLSENRRRVFVMYAIEGYNHREISELRKISISTSKWHLAQAKETLKKLLLESNKTILKQNSIKRTIL